MHARVQDAVTEYEEPGDFMKVYVLVQRQKQRKPARS